MEKYKYEFSQYDDCDVNRLGLYGYKYLDHYWTDKNRWAYFILTDEKMAGFVMVNDFPEAREETDHSLSEFFVMYKYRRRGVGKYAAMKVFDMFHGRWQVMRHPKNIGSVHFWDNVIQEYTKGNFRLVKSCPDAVYEDGTFGGIFFFDT